MMRAAILLSAVVLAAAVEDPAAPSLRGGRSLSDVAADAPAAAGDRTPSAAEGAPEDAMGDRAPVADEGAPGSAMPEGAWWGPVGLGSQAAGANETGAGAADLAALMAVAGRLSEGGGVSEGGVEALLLMSGGWHQGGDKMWGSGSGIEVVDWGNVGYYDAGMYEARARCGDAGCALIVNPPGHRSVHHFHIHFVHYHSYGRHLKETLESRACGRPGWHYGGFPCGGRAAYFDGSPGVFSKAMTGGNIHHASVIAWPASCGGRGTIVELAYDCSIEHQIRGDYNPNYR